MYFYRFIGVLCVLIEEISGECYDYKLFIYCGRDIMIKEL